VPISGSWISARTTRFADNGIKLCRAHVNKLSDEFEARWWAVPGLHNVPRTAPPSELGAPSARPMPAASTSNSSSRASAKGLRLDGLRVGRRLARHGDRYKVAPTVFLGELVSDEFSRSVVPTEPDGFNINRECGRGGGRSIGPGKLLREVLALSRRPVSHLRLT